MKLPKASMPRQRWNPFGRRVAY